VDESWGQCYDYYFFGVLDHFSAKVCRVNFKNDVHVAGIYVQAELCILGKNVNKTYYKEAKIYSNELFIKYIIYKTS
jgi:hypothetical protein